MAEIAKVSPQYFHTIGLRLEAGRFFTDADLTFTEKEKDVVAIVNHTFARHFFPNEDPVGKQLSGDKKHKSEIIGIISDYRPLGTENGTRPQIFWPYLKLHRATLVVRTVAAPQSHQGDPERSVVSGQGYCSSGNSTRCCWRSSPVWR